MKLTFKAISSVALAAAVGGFAMSPRIADACGGLFCNNIPVEQTEEQIIFEVDPPNNSVTAIINVVYQGAAEEFAWLLPLQTDPTDIQIGSRNAFAVAQSLTQPRFSITEIEDVGVCSGYYYDQFGGAEDATAGGPGAPAPNQRADGDVTVLQRDEVGPYDMVVLSGTDPEEIRQWLVDNGFRVTPEMMELVVPYVAQGDVILALKLLNNVTDVGEIAPIEVTMNANLTEQGALEACVPIRLTAVAANADMPITVYLFTDAGRAIPQNYFHVEPNLLKINWINGGSNYRQVIADAVDEADAGHAFTTEYAGSPDIFEKRIFDPDQFDLDLLRAQTDLGQFLQELINQGLLRRPGMRPILEKNFESVKQCPSCSPFDFNGEIIDAGPVVDEIDEKILAPDRRAQTIMDRRQYFTRMLTILDPEEMTVDPIFAYDSNLSEVSNVHTAKMIRDCGVGGTPGSAGIQIVLEDGRVIAYESYADQDNAVIDAMPAAARIEQLAEGIVVRDNSPQIEQELDEHNSRNGMGGCGCDAADESTKGMLSSFGLASLLGLVLLGRGRRRR